MLRGFAGVLVLSTGLSGGCGRTSLYDLPPEASPAIDLATTSDLALPDFAVSRCSSEALLVYVVDRATRMLSSFRPDTLNFQDIGVLDCTPPGPFAPESMAVQRDGTAWVVYTDWQLSASWIARVDVGTAACDPVGYSFPRAGPIPVGMAIALDAGTENLYVMAVSSDSPTGIVLGTVDLTTFILTPIGPLVGRGDLTGDPRGHLFAFLPDWSGVSTRLVDVDKSSGASAQTWTLSALDNYVGAMAVAAWGGQLWLFAENGTGGPTAVFRFDPSTGQESTVIADTGRHIVGAGVAPCY